MIATNLRISEEIWKKLKKIALEEERSINGEINFIIRKYIEEYEKRSNNEKK